MEYGIPYSKLIAPANGPVKGILAIANINVWNRFNVAVRQLAGAWKGVRGASLNCRPGPCAGTHTPCRCD